MCSRLPFLRRRKGGNVLLSILSSGVVLPFFPFILAITVHRCIRLPFCFPLTFLPTPIFPPFVLSFLLFALRYIFSSSPCLTFLFILFNYFLLD